MKWNEIYDDTIVKTTVNIPKDLMKQVKKQMRQDRVPFFSIYVRRALEEAVVNSKPQSLTTYDKGYMTTHNKPKNKFFANKFSLWRKNA